MKIKNATVEAKFKRNGITLTNIDNPLNAQNFTMSADEWRKFNKWYKINKKRLMTKPKTKKIKVKAVKNLKLPKEAKIATDNSQPQNVNQH